MLAAAAALPEAVECRIIWTCGSRLLGGDEDEDDDDDDDEPEEEDEDDEEEVELAADEDDLMFVDFTTRPDFGAN